MSQVRGTRSTVVQVSRVVTWCPRTSPSYSPLYSMVKNHEAVGEKTTNLVTKRTSLYYLMRLAPALRECRRLLHYTPIFIRLNDIYNQRKLSLFGTTPLSVITYQGPTFLAANTFRRTSRSYPEEEGLLHQFCAGGATFLQTRSLIDKQRHKQNNAHRPLHGMARQHS